MLGLDQVNKNLLILNNFQLQRRRKNFINYKHTSHLSWHLTQTGPYPIHYPQSHTDKKPN